MSKGMWLAMIFLAMLVTGKVVDLSGLADSGVSVTNQVVEVGKPAEPSSSGGLSGFIDSLGKIFSWVWGAAKGFLQLISFSIEGVPIYASLFMLAPTGIIALYFGVSLIRGGS